MNIEDIKVGETYYVPFTVRVISDKYVTATTGGTLTALLLAKTLHPIPSAPKYDPCRKLKVGDVVRVLKINGNLPKCNWAGNIPKEGVTGIVRELRKEDHFVWIDCKEIVGYCIDPAYLELVTPVEEIEPYCVRKYSSFYAVEKYNNHVDRPATYDIDFHPNAKKSAEAECARLNAEYRKEQSND